ncbi:ABC transporter permease [Vulcaniibacterium tengchongense]|uniref:Sodium transport system permease protein n=1 Tax=Vulcaniibacterium tengchongense TaxID=1273429 RepID=A0A3N4VAV3_9GAMM|nr:ABC transporter permease [Vulcaniibacterium tengchongense]RPE80112.1 sodium transport system permease protein [Vulcaniibacterium tengchongense]
MTTPNVFSAVWTVMRKELRDIGRDRRTLALALLLGPLLYPVLMIGIGALAEGRARTQLDKTLELPVAGREHAPNLVAFLATQGIRAVDAPADLDAAVARQDADVGLRIDPGYAEAWRAGRPALVEVVHDSTRRNAEIPVLRVRRALEGYRDQVGALRLLVRGLDPGLTRALAVGSRDVASADAKRGLLLSGILPYLLILMAFLGGAYLIIDATAGERERQSLEPLLATPAPRGAIVSGKIAAACALGLLSLLLTLLAFKLGAQLATGVARLLDVRWSAMGKMLLVLLPMLFVGTTLLTFLAAAAKSVKEAQSHMTWLMLLPMLPTIALAANPIKTAPWQYAVPFLAQNQMLLKVIRGEAIEPATWAIYLGASCGLAALLWCAAVWRYRQERLAISG